MADTKWVVVTDFDGTLTEKDIGNELCKVYIPEKYDRLHKEYKDGLHTLKSYQQDIWTNFPCNEEAFKQGALRLGKLRPGVNEFLEKCAQHKIPVYIASCGMDAYIQPVIDAYLSDFAKAAINGLCCNQVKFDSEKITEYISPTTDPNDPLPLHKGTHAQEMKNKHNGMYVAAFGNGRSDRSFIGKVDHVYATEGLLDHCEELSKKEELSFSGFSDFKDLFNAKIFSL